VPPRAMRSASLPSLTPLATSSQDCTCRRLSARYGHTNPYKHSPAAALSRLVAGARGGGGGLLQGDTTACKRAGGHRQQGASSAAEAATIPYQTSMPRVMHYSWLPLPIVVLYPYVCICTLCIRSRLEIEASPDQQAVLACC
jgi:hypothetical protein